MNPARHQIVTVALLLAWASTGLAYAQEPPTPYCALWEAGTPRLFEQQTTQLFFDQPEGWRHLLNGWRTRSKVLFTQDKHVWATELEASLLVNVAAVRELALSIKVRPHFVHSMPAQSLRILWEGVQVGTCDFEKNEAWQFREVSCSIPAAIVKSGRNKVTIVSRYTVARKELGLDNDTRPAAFALESLTLSAPGVAATEPRPHRCEGTSLVQPGMTRLRFPMRLPSSGPISLRAAASGLAQGDGVILRYDTVEGPVEQDLGRAPALTDGTPWPFEADLTPWAGRLVEIVLDATGTPASGDVLWQEAAVFAPEPAPEPAPPASEPVLLPGVTNVVFVILDALRADALHCYGNPYETSPFIDSLAASGVLFEQCYAAATETYCSTTSLLTSLHPFQHGVTHARARLQDEARLLQKVLGAAGVFTGCVSQNPYLSQAYAIGTGFGDMRETFGTDLDTGRKVTENALDIAAKHKGERLFLYAHYLPPHAPYNMSGDYLGSFSVDPVREISPTPNEILRLQKEGKALPDARAAVQLRNRYFENTRLADDLVRDLVQGLRAQGYGAETALIVSADHGEEFNESGYFGHGGPPYQWQAHVPLIVTTVAEGGLGQATRRAGIVRTVDQYPAIAALLGVTELPQISGVNYLAGQASAPEGVQAFTHGMTSAAFEGYVLGRYKWMDSRTYGWTRLYDLAADPLEERDLALLFPVLANFMAAQADVWRSGLAPLAPTAEQSVAPSEEDNRPAHREQLEALGYVQ